MTDRIAAGDKCADATWALDRAAYVKPCPRCHKVAGELFVTEPPLLGFIHWWRCKCGNIWALRDRGVDSLETPPEA